MPTLISPTGAEYRTEDAVEITRLRARGYAVGTERPPTVVDEQFHPTEHNVDEVADYLEDHPDDTKRVIAEEKAGKARKSIVGE